jgi:serpin B
MDNKIIYSVVGLLLAAGALMLLASGPDETGIACTADAMICPDGSAVGRVGPNCEFAPCPDVPGEAECNQDSDCFIGGCSSHICSPNKDIITTCEWREEYDCVRLTSCSCIDGKCGWEETPEYLQCLRNAKAAEPGPLDLLDDSQTTESGVATVVAANNEFAIDFYKEVTATESGNVFFSPWSLESALAMTYEGAKGQTAEEMASVLKIPEELSVRGPAFARLFNQINAPSKEYMLSTANALWVEKTYNLLESFTDTVSSYYGGGANDVDFKNDADAARLIINAWVEEKTYDKIKDLIPPGMVDSMTRLVLTNAVYFKGDWKTQFDPKDTRDAEFRKAPDETVTVDMMYLKESEFKHLKTDDVQLLEMPYSGDELSMVILLPTSDSVEGLEEGLTAEGLKSMRSQARETEIPVYLPKFKFKTKYFLSEQLSKMGMPLAFTGTADFSGMSGVRDLFISEVIHQAYVDVNEEGTEAAAATAVVMKLTAVMDPLEFRADHPFIFMIMKGDQILFMGRVTDPTMGN